MEEHQARKQPPQAYQISYNLARQPYPVPDSDDEPLEEDINVVPLSGRGRVPQVPPGSAEFMPEEPLTPRTSPKRKQTGSSKARSATGKPPGAKSYRPPQSAKQQPFADELQYLEELAERINHVLAERARQKAYQEQSQAMQAQAQYRSPQPAYGQPTLEELDTENLKLQARRIRQRLSQLEVLMDQQVQETEVEPDWRSSDRPSSSPPPAHPAIDPRYGQAPFPQSAPQHNPYDPVRQHSDYEAWRANEEYRYLLSQAQWMQPTGGQPGSASPAPNRLHPSAADEPLLQQAISQVQRLPIGQFLMPLPAKVMDRLTDAAMWVIVAAIARIALRYLLSAFPFFSPILTLVMLAPAALAIFLALFVPRTGWIPFYRLFLIMAGFFIGGKFF